MYNSVTVYWLFYRHSTGMYRYVEFFGSSNVELPVSSFCLYDENAYPFMPVALKNTMKLRSLIISQ